MKRLVITSDCEGATIETMRQAQAKFDEYALPFSESCWVFAKSGVSLLDYGDRVTRKHPDYEFLEKMIASGRIDTLHTWGDFPDGSFSRGLAAKAWELLKDTAIRFQFWTAHGGTRDYQNLSSLGQGDVQNSPYYHMDFTQQLGLRFYCRNDDIDVTRPSRNLLSENRYFKRFRGPTKQEVHSITLKWFHRQIELAERRTLWHRPPDDVIIYTHFYAKEDNTSPLKWVPMSEFEIPEQADTCLRKLAERKDRGELQVLRLGELLSRYG